MAIYLDHNATTPLLPEAHEAMAPYLRERFGNASSVHRWGQEARLAVERARDDVAALVGSPDPASIVFTSGGTESLNLAIRGVAHARPELPILASAIEHPSVLETIEDLAGEGRAWASLPVDDTGVIVMAEASARIAREALVVVMHANNEIGTIQPVASIGRMAAAARATLLVDAVQSAGKLPIDVGAIGADLLAVSAHKIGGPKGAGALYVRPGTAMRPLVTGGPQERRRRAGTENVAAIVGMGAAARHARAGIAERGAAIAVLRDRLEQGILERVPGTRVAGASAPRLTSTTCILFPGISGEALVGALDLSGVAASTGAACASGSTEASHVLLALGLSREVAASAVRFSLGPCNDEGEIAAVLERLPPICERLRALR